MLVVGLNTSGYVSSAAIVRNGELAFACAEERFDRQKFSKYFPWNAIRAGLNHVSAELSDVDCFAVGYNPGISIAGRTRTGFSEWPAYPGARLFSNPNYLLPELGGADFEETVQIFRRRDSAETRIRYVTHHLAHATNAFLLSGFDEAAVFTCDGYGERTTTTFGRANRSGIEVFREIHFPHSIGSLYATLTQFLGFRSNAEEWKVMGAAAYGDPWRYHDSFRRLLHWDACAEYEIDLSYFNYFDFDVAPMFRPKLEALLGPRRNPAQPMEQRHFDLAASLQQLVEDYLLDALAWLKRQSGCPSVCLAGGVLMNSVFNGKAALNSGFERVFVPYAPDDNGNSIGAALWASWQEGALVPGSVSASPFLGRSWDTADIRRILEGYRLAFIELEDLVGRVAEILASGKIVGWFQGRGEFGDRALGARSILGDPRDASMKDRINGAVKYREHFRPFAPAILEEAQLEYFDVPRLMPSPYMEKVFRIREEVRGRIPAVVHHDGSGRLQTVRCEENGLFYQLIDRFRQLTDVPVLLNTSFNLNGEPIVESPADAVRTFYSSGMDTLAIGPFLLSKETVA
jgi:carbamoyltransferase